MNQCGYKTVEILGVGTFGTVYKCLDANNNERCIKRIKLINATRLAATVHIELIQQEIYLLQNLSHPRVISLYDYFFSNDGKYIHIVMEYARKGPLSKLIATKLSNKDIFQETEIKRMFIEIVSGLEFLHIKNVIHKDIKPDNILVTNNGHLKIADFGVSKITNIDNCDLTAMFENNKLKEIGGSPLYMAPETLLDNIFSEASDIWALGCILYELCMLDSPFHSATSMDELIKFTTRRLYRPIGSVRMYSKELIDVCDWMLMPNVNARATISNIISSPSIMIQYYYAYFDF